MPKPEEILKGSPGKKKEVKPQSKKKKVDHVDAHLHVTAVVPGEGVTITPVDAFPVKPRPFARTTHQAFREYGRSPKMPSGYSTYHRFDGHGRPIDGVFYSA